VLITAVCPLRVCGARTNLRVFELYPFHPRTASTANGILVCGEAAVCAEIRSILEESFSHAQVLMPASTESVVYSVFVSGARMICELYHLNPRAASTSDVIWSAVRLCCMRNRSMCRDPIDL